jgi:hypothetical protein
VSDGETGLPSLPPTRVFISRPHRENFRLLPFLQNAHPLPRPGHCVDKVSGKRTRPREAFRCPLQDPTARACCMELTWVMIGDGMGPSSHLRGCFFFFFGVVLLGQLLPLRRF